MNTTTDYLDALKLKLGVPSDYALAPKIGLSKQMISRFRQKKDYFSDEMCLKAAQILEIDEVIVLAAIHAERAKSDKEKKAWIALFERLGGVAAAMVLGIGITTTPAPVQASSQTASYNSEYYVKSRKRKKRQFNPLKLMVEQLLQPA